MCKLYEVYKLYKLYDINLHYHISFSIIEWLDFINNFLNYNER